MLKSFSLAPVIPNFRIKISLDTNILSYLIDNKYSNLNHTIDFFESNEFVDLIATNYVFFELMEVRKREYFEKSAKAAGFNLSSSDVYQYKTSNRADNFYYSLLPTIKEEIEKELKDLTSIYSFNIAPELPVDIWRNTHDICLLSRLSRKDSFVLTTSLLPDLFQNQALLVILTNDKDFPKFFIEGQIEEYFKEEGCCIPKVNYIRNLNSSNNSKFSIIASHTQSENENFIKSYLHNLIIEQNKELFLGYTDRSFSSPKADIIGLKLKGEGQLKQNQRIIIIGKDLDFIVTNTQQITEFRNSNSKAASFPITKQEKRVVFKWSSSSVPELLAALKETGNLVFIHPDS